VSVKVNEARWYKAFGASTRFITVLLVTATSEANAKKIFVNATLDKLIKLLSMDQVAFPFPWYSIFPDSFTLSVGLIFEVLACTLTTAESTYKTDRDTTAESKRLLLPNTVKDNCDKLPGTADPGT
jgi:hypothetical protein